MLFPVSLRAGPGGELKGLKSELAALDRKIQLELAKDDEPQQDGQKKVVNSEVMPDMQKTNQTPNKGLKP